MYNVLSDCQWCVLELHSIIAKMDDYIIEKTKQTMHCKEDWTEELR
jgi:hypothetical protein